MWTLVRVVAEVVLGAVVEAATEVAAVEEGRAYRTVEAEEVVVADAAWAAGAKVAHPWALAAQ
jgi:hypothetical protein